ncbi:GNAT family N-acetyltransferase [Crateriforma spongiae]|uniref:GNAT family N-acetyltransferase n=1 Tax=Crateriforma spongiae TaxID=2724528 RepID=UPI0039AF2203
MGSVEISLLADHTDAIRPLSEHFQREWPQYYGVHGPGDAVGDLRRCSGRDELPIGLVAIANGTICGTVSLKTESPSPQLWLFPWMGALYVTPDYRRQGIAARLISAAEQMAKKLGFERVFVAVGAGPNSLEQAFARRGWQPVGIYPSLFSEVKVLQKLIAD